MDLAETGRPTVTTYLEMLEPPKQSPSPFPCQVQVLRCLRPSTDYYRFLYHQVGRDWAWKDRNQETDEQLSAALQRPGLELWVLFYEGHPAGYSELLRVGDEAQLLYFGLFPQFIGQGLGARWLDWTIRRAWAEPARRLWVHTCTLDHPNALPTYLKSGFRIYKVECP